MDVNTGDFDPGQCFWIYREDGEPRACRRWLPDGPDAQLEIAIVPGLGEHTGRYIEFASRFTACGFAVTAMDLIGHGHSPGRFGCIHSYEDLLTDVDTLVRFAGRLPTDESLRSPARTCKPIHLHELRSESPKIARPVFLFGHSMGGNLVLNAIMRRATIPAGAIASSPMLRAVKPMSDAYLATARFLMKLMPNYRLKAPVKKEYLSRDTAQTAAYARDELVHRFISLRLGAALIDSGLWVLEHPERLTIPTLLLHGLKDQITDAKASQELAAKASENCSSVFFPDLLHDTHRDIGRNEFFRVVLDWLHAQTTAFAG
ncbi:MAG: alpha/beta hydrolase [Pirellulales bacterium]